MSTLPGRAVLLGDPVVRFFLIVGTLYLGWYLLYALVLAPLGHLDRAMVDSLVHLSGHLLESLGYELIPEPPQPERTLGVQGGTLLWVGNACNGVGIFAAHVAFMVGFPGSWRRKLWYIPFGLLSIHVINVVRIATLCIITTIDYELLTFNHDYTFHVVVYGWVIFLWYAWTKWFAGTPQRPQAG